MVGHKVCCSSREADGGAKSGSMGNRASSAKQSDDDKGGRGGRDRMAGYYAQITRRKADVADGSRPFPGRPGYILSDPA